MSRSTIAGWKKACYAAVVCVAFFLAAEFVLAIVGVEQVVDREDPFHGFSGLVSVFVQDGNHFRTRPAVSNGTFNDQSFLVDKPANGLRIFCLGGSSAYGYPWGARAAFASILGDVVAEVHADRHVEAINVAGVSYAMHRVNLVADEVIEYQPDILIIFSGHNEFVEPDFFDALKHRSVTRNRFDYLLAHSRLYSALHAFRQPSPAAKTPFETRFAAAVQRDRSSRYSQSEKAAVVAEFRWRLRRLVRRAQKKRIHVVLATVPCNLSRWRPEASITETSLDGSERQEWRRALADGKQNLATGKPQRAIESLRRAAEMLPGHAETRFLLGQAYEAAERWKEARRCYVRACDDDASPSRRTSAINDTIREIAGEQHTLLVDCDARFTS
ncbi:MAG: tetratricopeptide repeat protein, partial [Pirellulales bacterium]